MLIFTRRIGEKVRIGDEIGFVILEIKGNQVRIGIDAPKDVPVHRDEIYRKIHQNQLKLGNNLPEWGDEYDEPYHDVVNR